MNGTQINQHYPHPERDSLQARFGLRISAYLSEQAQEVPYEVSERLRFAREQALDRARVQRAVAATAATSRVGGGSLALTLSGGRGFWWAKLASVLPLIALLLGLALIQQRLVGDRIAVAAEIDANILTDTLPPAAYADAGFVEFLKTP